MTSSAHLNMDDLKIVSVLIDDSNINAMLIITLFILLRVQYHTSIFIQKIASQSPHHISKNGATVLELRGFFQGHVVSGLSFFHREKLEKVYISEG